MIKFFDPKTKAEKTMPADKFCLGFQDPETGKVYRVPIMEIVEGSLDYAFITSHPYVYERQNGYISIQGGGAVLLEKLEKVQIDLIEQALKIKTETAANHSAKM